MSPERHPRRLLSCSITLASRSTPAAAQLRHTGLVYRWAGRSGTDAADMRKPAVAAMCFSECAFRSCCRGRLARLTQAQPLRYPVRHDRSTSSASRRPTGISPTTADFTSSMLLARASCTVCSTTIDQQHLFLNNPTIVCRASALHACVPEERARKADSNGVHQHEKSDIAKCIPQTTSLSQFLH